ncbi:MAG TPA: hypothetical protein ENJ82_00790 [Bacteroidetes bacterium]|nr:hypothetical protein [Bacteroidota bacterium]
MNKTSIFLLLILGTLPFVETLAQPVSFSLAADPVWKAFYVRSDYSTNENFRVGLEYAKFKDVLIGKSLNSDEKIFLNTWYSGFTGSIIVPIKEHWGIYGRAGAGILFSSLISTLGAIEYRDSRTFQFAENVAAGFEYRVERWRVFTDVGLFWIPLIGLEPPSWKIGLSFDFMKAGG